jgi:hypothetical protein
MKAKAMTFFTSKFCSMLIFLGRICGRINAMAQNPMERLFTNGMDKRRQQQQQQQGNPSLPCEATHQCAEYTIDNILLSVVEWCS